MQQPLPRHQQQVAVVVLDAALDLVPAVAGHGRDDPLGLGKGRLERLGLAVLHVKMGDLECCVVGRPSSMFGLE